MSPKRGWLPMAANSQMHLHAHSCLELRWRQEKWELRFIEGVMVRVHVWECLGEVSGNQDFGLTVSH